MGTAGKNQGNGRSAGSLSEPFPLLRLETHLTSWNGLRSYLNVGREVDIGRGQAGLILILWHTVDYWLHGGMEGNGFNMAKMSLGTSRDFVL